MAYTDTTIYFLTGTGNSYRAAVWMGEAARAAASDASLPEMQQPDRQYSCRIVPIQGGSAQQPDGGDLKLGTETASSESTASVPLVGFVFPTHGFTSPWLVIRFALHLPPVPRTVVRKPHAFVVATRAGTKIGNIHFPGLEGTAGYLIALILLLKGYDIRGVMGLDMPSNWTALHPGFSARGARSIIERARAKTDAFMQAILAGKRQFRGILPLLLGLLLVPISLGYLFVGRFYLAKLFYASEKCNGCGVCARNCPAGAIRMWKSGKHVSQRPYWTFSCESCMRCMNYCPEQAVEASHSLAVILYFVTSFSAGVFLLNWAAMRLPLLAGLNNALVQSVLQYLYILASIALTYLLFSLLIRIPLINRVFTFATLTHYYRRYHEPGTTIKDISTKS